MLASVGADAALQPILTGNNHDLAGSIGASTFSELDRDGGNRREGGDIRAHYFPLRHPDSTNFDLAQLFQWLRDLIASDVRIATQNGSYDWGWLRTDAGIKMPPADRLEETGRHIVKRPNLMQIGCRTVGEDYLLEKIADVLAALVVQKGGAKVASPGVVKRHVQDRLAVVEGDVERLHRSGMVVQFPHQHACAIAENFRHALMHAPAHKFGAYGHVALSFKPSE
jgi:hypothetical protein